MKNFDIAIKLNGIAAFCGTQFQDANIGAALLDGSELRDDLATKGSHFKSGRLPLGSQHKIRLANYMNERIAAALRVTRTDERIGPIRAELWDRPIDEFFQAVEDAFPSETVRLAHAHWAIADFFNSFGEYCSHETPLALSHYTPEIERSRFPDAAIPVDPMKLPPVQFRFGESMSVEITKPVQCDSNAWMFFIRNPELGESREQLTTPYWRQKPSDLVRWLASPFPLQQGFTGVLRPHFPSPVSRLEGQYTAYLLIEDQAASGVRECLEAPLGGAPWEVDSPCYESTIHLITVRKTLFQHGNVKNKGRFRPPVLYARRYVVKGR